MSPHSVTSEQRPTKFTEREHAQSPAKGSDLPRALNSAQSFHTPSPTELISQELSPGRESMYSHRSSPLKRAPTSNNQNASDREKQIDNLSRNLKKKIEEVFRAEDANKDLAEKIQKLKVQSDLSAKIAKEDYSLLQKELNRTSNVKVALEKEVTDLESEMIKFKSKANYLEIENRALMEESIKV